MSSSPFARGRARATETAKATVVPWRTSSFSFIFISLFMHVVPLHVESAPSVSPSSSCPLNFTVLDKFEGFQNQISQTENKTLKCVSIIEGLHLVLSEYVKIAGYFLVPSSSADSCWTALDQKFGISDIRSMCNYEILAISRGWRDCGGIQTVNNFTAAISEALLSNITAQCNASLVNAACSACTYAMVKTAATDLPFNTNGSVNTCQDIVYLYTASIVNTLGPLNDDTASCMFNIGNNGVNESNHSKYVFGSIGAAITFLLLCAAICFLYFVYRRCKLSKQKDCIKRNQEMLEASLNDNSATLRWFTMDEIKAATNNFSRFNIIGAGGFGNVYKGTLPDGSEVAVKRFKNCSPAGDADFLHEVKVISSVRHRNLIALRGCCVHTGKLEGHQRIIVYDLMDNGSLYDHLFVKKTSFDWLTRQNIAIGMAKGLAYLHQDVQPAIIHRDIKSSNILLDSKWNALVADFGLAKFTLDGETHLSTKVAGTQGYVAPEYALYGQLTQKSDVYSYGIVLLELLTGKKALPSTSLELEQPNLITDWAWSLVKKGSVAEVLDPTMANKGPDDVIERYVLVALLCAHPQVAYRPTIAEVLKILEDDQPLPSIPDRPIPLTSDRSAIENITGGNSGLSSQSGFQCYSSEGSSTPRGLK